jgi:hypothetical protein
MLILPRLKVRVDARRCRVQHRLSIGELNGLSMMVFSIGLRGYFTSFLAQTEEAQDCHYDHDDLMM